MENNVLKYYGKDLFKLFNELITENKDKLLIVLGKAYVGKSTFINSITKSNICPVKNKRTKEILIVKLFKEDYNFYFVDDLVEHEYRYVEEMKEKLEKLKNKGKINGFILVFNLSNYLWTSDFRILKALINIFPS